jgi:magnesium transporter
VINVYVHRSGDTQVVDGVDRAWLEPSAAAVLWVDLVSPTPEESRVLTDVFHFHPLSVEDALSEVHHPKVEPYDGYLYVILHGIDFEKRRKSKFATRDVDFFLGRNYLVTVHDGRSRTIGHIKQLCGRHDDILAEGPLALMHRIIDAMVENYRPEIEEFESQLNELEDEAVLGTEENLVRTILETKRAISSLRRVVIPQRDVVGRLARREFPQISDEMAYRFRDVYDALVRLADESLIFQDRITGILEAHLSTISNRLNKVMKVLTVMSTIFLPLTVLTSMWGMNVPLPMLPGGTESQFWWVAALMAVIAIAMLTVFRRIGWI